MARDPGFESSLEERVVQVIHDGVDELVEFVAELTAFDTTARGVGDEPRDEERLQKALSARLYEIGAEIDMWEPEPMTIGSRLAPAKLDFIGRPQLAALLQGRGGGRTLLLNGHIDAVTPGPLEDWDSDPFRAVVSDGYLWGRGVADMKGGLASLLFALQALKRSGATLLGDVVYCANTDEESSGAGSLACVRRGVGADAGICAEPTDFDAWVCCRGLTLPVITVDGRAGHAEMPQLHWREGGAVNAIEKACIVIDAVRTLREEWRERSDKKHWCLSSADIVPTLVQGGVWTAAYPPHCTITCDVQYLPENVDGKGTAKDVEAEIQEWINAAAAADPWLRANPLRWDWIEDYVPAEIPANHPLVDVVLRSAEDVGRRGKASGLDSWHDAANFTRWGNTPTLSFGPDGIDSAHSVKERVTISGLVDHCAAVALATMRWCGV